MYLVLLRHHRPSRSPQGMGLPEVSEKPEKKLEEEDKVSIFDAKFWIKDETVRRSDT